ncbi:MAG: BlaI/MecI/CopY family transcriptional regulator [Planctomycetes bacterium]|nr:BlaI/MecI/CopY family transcriptional regulator [Planctomycetota bacterium]
MAPRRKRPDARTPAITEAELTVLKSFWDDGPATVRELLTRLGTEWAYTTVQTLVTRLVDKGHVRADRRGVAHVFSAARPREEFAQLRVEEVASSLLDGAVAPLVLRLVENGRFSDEDIASFRQLLRDAERRNQGGDA